MCRYWPQQRWHGNRRHELFWQMGAFFLALIFGQIVQATHRFDYPVYVVGAVLIVGCLLWLGIDAEKGLPELGDGGERGEMLG